MRGHVAAWFRSIWFRSVGPGVTRLYREAPLDKLRAKRLPLHARKKRPSMNLKRLWRFAATTVPRDKTAMS